VRPGARLNEKSHQAFNFSPITCFSSSEGNDEQQLGLASPCDHSCLCRRGTGGIPALTQAINFPTECLGHDISIAENGRHTAGPHEGGASPIHRHAFGEDANQNFAFGYLEFERTADPRGELRRTSENAPAREGSARAEELMNSIQDWLAAKFDLPVIREAPHIEFIQPTSMAQIRYRGSAGNQAVPAVQFRVLVCRVPF
jgi:hypothetical protein